MANTNTNTISKAKNSTGRPSSAQRRAAADSGDRALDDGATTEESSGYDANAGPIDTGYASESISLASEGEADLLVESGLSVDAEDLGSRLIRDAKQEALPPEGSEVDTEADMDLAPEPASLREIYDDAPDEDAISPAEPSELDLTQNVITEGSLFDQPRNEGGIRHPAVRVNEVDATLERNARAAQARGHRRGIRRS